MKQVSTLKQKYILILLERLYANWAVLLSRNLSAIKFFDLLYGVEMLRNPDFVKVVILNDSLFLHSDSFK